MRRCAGIIARISKSACAACWPPRPHRDRSAAAATTAISAAARTGAPDRVRDSRIFGKSQVRAARASRRARSFAVSAPGCRKLTTQINIDGDPYLWDDFAFATRDGLVPAVKQAEGAEGKRYGVEGQFALIDFDFTLFDDRDNLPGAEVERVRAEA